MLEKDWRTGALAYREAHGWQMLIYPLTTPGKVRLGIGRQVVYGFDHVF